MKALQREVIDGVQITRVPLYPSHGQSGVGRLLNYISFAASISLYGLFRAKKPDVVYAYHPPLTVGIAAALVRFFRRVPVVYDIQDMWPDTLKATGMFSNEKLLKIVSCVCNWVYRNVDQIVVLSPGFKRLLIERGVPSQKIDVIYNWCSEDMVRATPDKLPTNFPVTSKFRILFAGNMGKAQSLDTVIDAAQLLQEQASQVAFIFLGGGVETSRLEALAKGRNLDNVFFLPAVPMPDVGAYLAAADALLVHLKKDPLFTITIPSKTQAYMAAGKPILMAVDGDAADLVRDAGCGVVSESDNPQALVDAVLALMEVSAEGRSCMAENGAAFYQKELSLRVGVERFGEHFKRMSK
ncbi:glycosyltransferase involved in cell wall biosynthesis [Pseudomonas sp. SJZ083]|nr:glycosyltransferase involved in cell wall biosynthesis [Pseudomonas sp. SJZ083]TWC46946.1 glycosyltransferase involved in cell wall biosynthesis [Pseudomonas sp. SJZ077]